MKSEIDQLYKSFPSSVAISVHNEDGRDVLHFKYGKCVATVGVGSTKNKHSKNKPWATVYKLDAQGGGRPEEVEFLLSSLKEYYEKLGYDFGFSFADTAILKATLYKLKIAERENGTGDTYKLQ